MSALGVGGLRMAALGIIMGCARQPCLLHGLRTVALGGLMGLHGKVLCGLVGCDAYGVGRGGAIGRWAARRSCISNICNLLVFLGWAKIVAIYLFCMDVAIFVIV